MPREIRATLHLHELHVVLVLQSDEQNDGVDTFKECEVRVDSVKGSVMMVRTDLE